jgi:hypothetical protein
MSDEPTRERNLQHLGGAMDAVVSELLQRTSVGTIQDLWSNWEDVAGPDWERTRPARLDRGALVVAVPDGGSATRLRYGISELLDRIAARLGDGVVTSVRLRIGRE